MSIILSLLGSLFWGSADFLGGKLSKRHRSLEVVGITQFVGLIAGVSLVAATRTWITPNLSIHGFLIPGILAGASGFTGLVAFYAGLATGRMGVVSPISSLSAILPMAIAFIGGEAPKSLQIIGMILALGGIFLASGPEVKGGISLRPLLLGCVAALGFGLAMTFMAQGSKTSALLTMTTMRCTSTVIVLILAIKYRTIGNFSTKEVPSLIFIGAADFFANVFLGLAVTRGLVSVSMVLMSLFPLVTAFWAYLFLKERLQRVQYVGVAIALAGLAAISVGAL